MLRIAIVLNLVLTKVKNIKYHFQHKKKQNRDIILVVKSFYKDYILAQNVIYCFSY